MEASSRLFREPMNELSFSLGRFSTDENLADNVAELIQTMNKPIGEINPWSLIGNAEALMTFCVGRVQQLSDDLDKANARINEIQRMVPYKGA